MKGLYAYATFDSSGECYVKVGKAVDVDRRLQDHRGSAGGLEVIATIDCSGSPWSLDTSEQIMIKNFKKAFGDPISGNETFRVTSLEAAKKLLNETVNEAVMNREYKGVTGRDYMISNLFDEEIDVRSMRPDCYWIKDRQAQVTVSISKEKAAGSQKSKYRFVNTYMDADSTTKFDKPKNVPMSQEGWYIWLAARETLRRELALESQAENAITLDMFT